MIKKRCPSCHRWLKPDESNFYRNRARPSGLSDRCRECTKKDRREASQKTKARNRAVSRAKGKAFRRLAKIHPEMFEKLYREELQDEGIKLQWTSLDRERMWQE